MTYPSFSNLFSDRTRSGMQAVHKKLPDLDERVSLTDRKEERDKYQNKS